MLFTEKQRRFMVGRQPDDFADRFAHPLINRPHPFVHHASHRRRGMREFVHHEANVPVGPRFLAQAHQPRPDHAANHVFGSTAGIQGGGHRRGFAPRARNAAAPPCTAPSCRQTCNSPPRRWRPRGGRFRESSRRDSRARQTRCPAASISLSRVKSMPFAFGARRAGGGMRVRACVSHIKHMFKTTV